MPDSIAYNTKTKDAATVPMHTQLCPHCLVSYHSILATWTCQFGL